MSTMSHIPRLSSTTSTESVEPDPAELGAALLDAAEDGDQPRVQKALQDGADVNYIDGHYTALHHAAGGGHQDLVAYLIDKGADVQAFTDQGGTALHVAAAENQVNMIRDLVWRGLKVNAAQTSDGCTPLHAAVLAGQKEATLEICKRGADTNLVDKSWQRTPLHIASKDGAADIVKILLEFKALPNLVDSTGVSSLHEAVGNDDTAVAAILLEHGADVHQRDEMTRSSPLTDAKTDEMKSLLNEYVDREPIYEALSPLDDGPEEVNPFKASMDMLKGDSSDSIDTSSGKTTTLPRNVTNDSPKVIRSTLPRDIKLDTPTSSPRQTRIPSPQDIKGASGSPLSRLKLFGSKDKLNKTSTLPKKTSPRVSRIPIDTKSKFLGKSDVSKSESDPFGHQARAKSLENLMDLPTGSPAGSPIIKSKIPKKEEGAQKRIKSPWGGKLDLSNRRSMTQYTSMPKDMKYTGVKDMLMVTRAARGMQKNAPINPSLPRDTQPPKIVVSLADPTNMDTTSAKSDSSSDISSVHTGSVKAVDGTSDEITSSANINDVTLQPEKEPSSNVSTDNEETSSVNVSIQDTKYQPEDDPDTLVIRHKPSAKTLGPPPPPINNLPELENNNKVRERAIDIGDPESYSPKRLSANFSIWQEDSSSFKENNIEDKGGKKKKNSGGRRFLCCCFGV